MQLNQLVEAVSVPILLRGEKHQDLHPQIHIIEDDFVAGFRSMQQIFKQAKKLR